MSAVADKIQIVNLKSEKANPKSEGADCQPLAFSYMSIKRVFILSLVVFVYPIPSFMPITQECLSKRCNDMVYCDVGSKVMVNIFRY